MADYRTKCQELLRFIPDLQCHKCQDVPGPKGNDKNRYSCLDSHTLCEKDKLKCPCGSLVGKNPSSILAKLMKDLPWMCQNYKKGCREIKKNISELEFHQRKWPNPLPRRKRDWIFHHVVAKPQVVKNKIPHESRVALPRVTNGEFYPIPFSPWWRTDIPILHTKFLNFNPPHVGNWYSMISILHSRDNFNSPHVGNWSIPHCWAMGNWMSYVNSQKCLESSF